MFKVQRQTRFRSLTELILSTGAGFDMTACIYLREHNSFCHFERSEKSFFLNRFERFERLEPLEQLEPR